MRWLTPLLTIVTSTAWAAELSVEHERFQLDNGLDVVLAPDHSAPLVHVEVWYHVGSKDERKGLTGFAHLFEHLMFQGSWNSPGEYFTPLQEVGANINGTTNTDRTNYFETLPSHFLPLALFQESDRMGNLLPVLDQAKLDNQREVVRNERRQRYENPPYGDVWVYLSEEVYPEGHPYHHTTIGSHEDLQNASLDDVKQFFRTWYVPNNATLVIAGDIDLAATRKLVEEQFGWIPRGEQPTPVLSAEASIPATKIKTVYDDVPDRKVWMTWLSPAVFADGDAALDIAASVLCSGKDSRLYDRLVTRDRIARDIGCYQGSARLSSRFVVSGTAADGHTTAEIAKAVDEEIAAFLGAQGPSADDVAAAVLNYEVGYYGALQTVRGRAAAISRYLDAKGVPDWLDEDLARYTSLTTDDVVKATRDTLTAPRFELHYLPKADEGSN